MSTQKTNLILATSGAHTPVKRTTRLFNAQSNLLKTLGPLWKNFDGDTKSGWLKLAQDLSANTQPSAKQKINAYATFVTVATNQVLSSQPIPTTAPESSAQPAGLPPMRLELTGAGSSLALSIVPTTPYSSKVQIYGARPLLLGQNRYSKLAFKYLGTVDALTASTDITALYKSWYSVPSTGYQVALKLYGLSANGLRIGPLFVTGQNPGDGLAKLTLK